MKNSQLTSTKKLGLVLKLILPVVLALLGSHFANAEEGDCHELPAPMVGGRYCVYRGDTANNRDIVYHLHGSGGNEKLWGEVSYYSELIRQHWAHQQLYKPTVVSISFGPTWLLAPRNSSQNSGLFDLMRDTIIPMIETSLGGLNGGQRIVVGESMGGFNAVQMAFRTSDFHKAAVLCAPMYNGITAFSERAELELYARRSTAFAYHGEKSLPDLISSLQSVAEFSKAFFPTVEDTAAADPLALANTVDPVRHFMPIYVTAGSQDKYVLFEGNVEFVNRLQAHTGVHIDWHPMYGEHCTFDIPSLAEFLAN